MIAPSAPPKPTRFEYVREWDDDFLVLFPHRYDYIWADYPQPGQKPNWKTEKKHALSDRLVNQGAHLYGVRFGQKTNYLLVDLDSKSIYHPNRDRLAVPCLADALEPLGCVDYIACTSSYSSGIHLYFPFDEAQNSYQLAEAAATLLENAGFVLALGQLEIFPNVKLYVTEGEPSLFNAHRLPLQEPGSYLLNQNWELTYTDQTEFVRRWKFAQSRNDVDSQRLAQILKAAKRKRYRISTNAAKFLGDLDAEIEPGWTGAGQTNYILGRIAMREYIFHHLIHGGEPLTGQALAEAIATNARSLPGFEEWCRHQNELDQKAAEWARSIEASHYYHYGSGPTQQSLSAIPTWNEQQSNAARERIKEAITDLLNQEALPVSITARRNALVGYGISHSTLSKYKDLWHPEFLSENPKAFQDKQLHPEPNQTTPINQLELAQDKQLHPATTNKLYGLAELGAPSEQPDLSPAYDVGGSGGISTGADSIEGIEFVRSILQQIQARRRIAQSPSLDSPPPDENYFSTLGDHQLTELPSGLSGNFIATLHPTELPVDNPDP